ncbi:MAG: family 78 glycoside hydrolase catalytic domain [Saprospiraceae bacterium]|nr:family 78 glycoside hydrolase catalytic domain [Saprospiraceae bacterium]
MFSQDSVTINALYCEYLDSPMGLENASPSFSWKAKTQNYNQSQQAYQILVASHPDLLNEEKADLWNSQKVKSFNSQQIKYKGKILREFKTYYWKVRIWGKGGVPSIWSKVGQWTTGYVDQDQSKKGNWIGLDKTLKEASTEEKGKAYYFFKDIEIEKGKKLQSAKVAIAGLGLFEFYLNGNKVGDHVLDPSDTDYKKRATYVLFDVLSYLKNQQNHLGVLLGNGKHLLTWDHKYQNYGLPRLYFELRLGYEDGTKQIVYSDTTWKWTDQTPILYNNEFKGETYDNRIVMPYNLDKNQRVKLGRPLSILEDYNPKLSPQLQEPRRVIEEVVAREITEPEPNVYVFDFGQNLTGWCNLRIKTKRGTKISMRAAELLWPNGKIDTSSVRDALATDHYIVGSDSLETYHPRFTYHGFRYVCVRGLPERPDTNTLRACVVHNDLNSTGSFTSDNKILNAVYENTKWTLRSNYQSLPLDCPQRDERVGWLGDRAATVNGEAFVYDIHAIYRKWLLDIQDAQSARGQIPNVAPPHWRMYRDNMTWPVAYPYIADRLYRQYGNTELIHTHYESIKSWIAYIEEHYYDNGIVFCDQYGDWSIPPNTVDEFENRDPRLKSSADILATVAYLHTLSIMSNWAEYLNLEEDRTTYLQKYKRSTKRLYQDYMDHSIENYGNNTPTELVLLLSTNELNTAQRDTLLYNLEGKLKGQYNERLVFGLIGVRWLLRTLTKHGKLDLAYDLASQTSYPSLGYMTTQGATTLWEHWNGDNRGSHNHIMLSGDLLEWYYTYLGGIQQDETHLYSNDYQAYQNIILHPHIPQALGQVEVGYDSPQGEILSSWKKNQLDEEYPRLDWTIKIPMNTRAEVRIPCALGKTAEIKIDGKTLKSTKIDGFELGEYVEDSKNQNYQIIYLGSGEYQINSTLEKKEKELISTAPIIYPQDTLVKAGQEVLVKMTSSSPKSKIYYTLDGSDPSPKSKRYRKPFVVDQYSVVKAISVEKRKQTSFIKNAVIDFYDPKQNGWKYRYYEKHIKSLPNFDTLKPLAQGYIPDIDVYHIRKRPHNWLTCFESNLKIPKDGLYTFYLASDDGAACYIDDKLLIKNDGLHYKTQRAQKIYLTKGYYKIKLEHFNFYSIASLELGISSKDLPRQKVPISFLYYKGQ